MSELTSPSSRLDWISDTASEARDAQYVTAAQLALQQYAGTSVKYYESAKERLAISNTGFAKFNLACAVFGPIWAAWRRLAFLCTVIAIVDIIILILISQAIWLDHDSVGYIGFWPAVISFVLARCFWGSFANAFFFHRYTKWCSNRWMPAGTSLLSALASAVVVIFIAALMIYRFSFDDVPSYITDFPTNRNIAFSSARAIDDFVLYLTIQYGPFFDAISVFMRSILNALKFTFVKTPWPVTALLMLLAAWHSGGIKVLAFTFCAILYIGLFGFWHGAMDTLSLVAGSVLVCIVFGVPIGIWSAKSSRANTIISPILVQ